MDCIKIANTAKLSRDEWLRIRKGGIGGSDIGAIMGVNRFSSPLEVFLDKTTDRVTDLSDNDAVYWGTVLEDVVAKEFEKRTGKKVAKMNAILQIHLQPHLPELFPSTPHHYLINR